jgi:hypothetical protein
VHPLLEQLDWDREESAALDLFQRLLRFDTTNPPGNERECIAWIQQLLESSGFKMGVNYGWNKIRFPAPVPAGSRIRGSVETLAVDDMGGGWHQITQKWTVEVEGSEKPACVAESVGRVLA